MARLAAAFGSSHSVMLAATAEDWTRFRESDPRMPYYDRDGRSIAYADLLARAPAGSGNLAAPELLQERFGAAQQAMARMKEEIAAAKLDALVVVGDDQHELFQDQHMPALAIYHGESIRNAAQPQPLPSDWYKRAQARRREESGDVNYPCDAKLARHLIEGLIEREFDVSAVAALAEGQFEGHAYSFVHRWYLKGAVIPIVPVFLNTYNAPNTPLPRRCVSLGHALKKLIESFPEKEKRIGLIASGGLSHFVCDEELDRGVIDALKRKDFAHLAALDPRRLKAGSSEIRNWIVVAAAAADLKLDWLSYTPVYRTPALTGIGLGFARWS
jgi:3-O-methylgallate 3,4-dioxygenase